MLSRMKIGQDSDSDSDLEDPDVEELELLRRALGTRYTAEGHDPDIEGESDDNAGVDEQEPALSDQDNAVAQHEGLLSSDVEEDSESSPPGSPHGMPSSSQHDIEPQHGSRAHAASAHTGDVDDDDVDEDIVVGIDEGDDEEWEAAPSRAELLRDTVQYLRQASAEQGAVDESEGQHDSVPPNSALEQEEHTISKLQRALKANRRLQGRLVGILEAIDGAIWSNAEMQAKLMHNSQQHPRAGRYKGMRGVTNATWGEADVTVVGPSQFWVAGRNVPEPNADTLRVAPVFQYLPQHFKDSSWLPEDTACLTDILLKAAQRAQRAETANALASGSRSRQQPPGRDEDGNDSQTALTLQSKGVEGTVNGFSQDAWEDIARLGPAGRTAEECWKQWTHQLRPSLNKDDWTADEDTRLVELVNRLGTHAWDEVAEGLGSGRTPAGCLSQYQRCHKGDALLNSKWTPEEATRLAQVIAELGTRDWQAVAAKMGGRTPGQVQHFYQDNLSKCYKKGAWDPEEDEALKQAVKTCGKHWREIAKHVPTRTDKQCRERYANVLDPELKLYAEWTPQEDALLHQAIKEHTQPNGKVKWAAVARMIPGRTDHVCVRHYKQLTRTTPARHVNARAVRQRSGRFVAWEKNPIKLPAPGAEPLQIEGRIPAASAKKGVQQRKRARRAKRNAAASNSEDEQELELDSRDIIQSGKADPCESPAADPLRVAGVTSAAPANQRRQSRSARATPSAVESSQTEGAPSAAKHNREQTKLPASPASELLQDEHAAAPAKRERKPRDPRTGLSAAAVSLQIETAPSSAAIGKGQEPRNAKTVPRAVGPPEMPAPSEEEPPQVLGAPSAPPKLEHKPGTAKTAKRAEQRAEVSSLNEDIELHLNSSSEDRYHPGASTDAGPDFLSKNDQKEPALGRRQQPRQSSRLKFCSKRAEGDQDQATSAIGEATGAYEADASERQPHSSPSEGIKASKPSSGGTSRGSNDNAAQHDAHGQEGSPQQNEEVMRVVETRKKGRKRKAG